MNIRTKFLLRENDDYANACNMVFSRPGKAHGRDGVKEVRGPMRAYT